LVSTHHIHLTEGVLYRLPEREGLGYEQD